LFYFSLSSNLADITRQNFVVAVDDPLDAVAVHFGGGMWGLIAASLFDNNGLVFGATYESALASSLCILAHSFTEILFEFVGICRNAQ
jgi:ammonia channel protein AmtB